MYGELVCLCGGSLAVEPDVALTCTRCGESYPIVERIPIILEEEYRRNDYDELYGDTDFDQSPFEYPLEYIQWRKAKINSTIVEYLPLAAGQSVLDDGGGYGYLRHFLPSETTYYNLDFSYEIIRFDRSSKRCVGRGERLPYRDDFFDNVVSGDVLEHVADKVRYLNEAYRVLKPGGRFVVNTPRTGWVDSLRHSRLWWLPYLDSLCREPGKVVRKLGSRIFTADRKAGPAGPDPQTEAIQDSSHEQRGHHPVVDIPSDPQWLEQTLTRIGFAILDRTYTDNRPAGFTNRFWRWFADRYIAEERHGHCILIACEKP
ncbi:MAG TPA: methyltransferase domain-containing protein [Anaerolineae bacterium]|nr:methyltransferase domain-containing protein [Anaerolineae bacterium]